jgi:hypothetical protein
MGVFKQKSKHEREIATEAWEKWGGLYQEDGGSIDTKTAYNYFLSYLQQAGVIFLDRANVSTHSESTAGSQFEVSRDSKRLSVRAKKVFLAVGPSTPHFLKRVMGVSHLVDYNTTHAEFTLEEKVRSYFKIRESSDGCESWLGSGLGAHSSTPAFFHFMATGKDQSKGAEATANFFGFRYHCWDNPTETTSRLMAVGTTAKRILSECSSNEVREVEASDCRAQKAVKYAK